MTESGPREGENVRSFLQKQVDAYNENPANFAARATTMSPEGMSRKRLMAVDDALQLAKEIVEKFRLVGEDGKSVLHSSVASVDLQYQKDSAEDHPDLLLVDVLTQYRDNQNTPSAVGPYRQSASVVLAAAEEFLNRLNKPNTRPTNPGTLKIVK